MGAACFPNAMTDSKLSPQYRNLDVEVYSRRDLTPLAEHFGRNVCVLYCDRWGDKTPFLLALEPSIRSRRKPSPARDLEHFLDLFDNIPGELQDLWSRRTRLHFDFGIEGGLMHPNPEGHINLYSFDLPPDLLRRVSILKGKIVMTIYPYAPEDQDPARPET